MVSPEITLTYIIGIFCATLTLSVGIFTFFKSAKKVAALTYLLLTTSIAVYYASHLVGINAPNATVAWYAFMFNLTNIFIICFNLHFVYKTYGQEATYRKIILALAYGIGLILFIFYLLYPMTFMQLPVHKLYLPYYYVPGSLYWVMRLYFFVFSLWMIADLAIIYRKTDYTEKNRIKYMFAAILYAYTLGSTALFLLYNVPIDPIYSMFFGLYTLPLAYSFLKYDPLNIQIIAKNAILYSSGVVIISIIIILINTASNILVLAYPGFPAWVLPFLLSCIAVVIGNLVWKKLQEVEKLKYEFITVVTHKFRTPLTYIKWSIDNFTKNTDGEAQTKAIDTIRTANIRLTELTDLLIGLEQTEGSEYTYSFTDINLSELVEKTISGDKDRIQDKSIFIDTSVFQKSVFIHADKRRLEFAMQIILENAISYSPVGSVVEVSVTTTQDRAIVSIKDSGIGIPKEELPFIFTKFFRGSQAKLTDTEGMGIGLYVAKNIISRQGGTIWVASKGLNRGTTFFLSFPLKK